MGGPNTDSGGGGPRFWSMQFPWNPLTMAIDSKTQAEWAQADTIVQYGRSSGLREVCLLHSTHGTCRRLACRASCSSVSVQCERVLCADH